jgi:hypothetical protein
VIAYVIGLSYNNANREKRKMPSFFLKQECWNLG